MGAQRFLGPVEDGKFTLLFLNGTKDRRSFVYAYIRTKKENTRLSDCPLSFLRTGGRVITRTSRDSGNRLRIFLGKNPPRLSPCCQFEPEGRTVTRDAVSSSLYRDLIGIPPSWNFVNYRTVTVYIYRERAVSDNSRGKRRGIELLYYSGNLSVYGVVIRHVTSFEACGRTVNRCEQRARSCCFFKTRKYRSMELCTMR